MGADFHHRGGAILAITVDAMGFCGKFFAERIEEVELSTSMQLLRYDEALMVIIVIFAVVLVEQVSSLVRKAII